MPSSPIPPLLVDIRAACALLGGVCEKTIENYRKERGLPSVKIGNGRRLYSPAALADWINSQSEPANKKAAPARAAESENQS
jgi:hypothetical protein